MKKFLSELGSASLFLKGLRAVGRWLKGFFSGSAILHWFGSEEVTGESRTDKLFAWFLQSKFCDFLRSGFLLKLIASVPALPWCLLMLTLAAAMALPTLLVMLLSAATLAVTFVHVLYGKLKLPCFNGGAKTWVLFALVTLIYTFVSYGGMKSVLAGGIRFAMLLLFPSAWVIFSEKKRLWWSLRFFGVVCFGVSGYGLYQYVSGAMRSTWTDTELFSEEFGRLTATFENPNVYGTFLLLAVPIMLMATLFAKTLRGKLLFGLTTLMLGVNMILTYSRGCYVSLVLIFFILLLCKGGKLLWAGFGALALSPMYLPDSVMQRVASIGNLGDTSIAFRMNIWKGVLKMIERYWFMGVGIGDAAFTSIYKTVALETIEDAPHAHNLFFQIICESGVLGLVIVLAMFVFMFRSAISALKGRTGQERWIRLTLIACWVGLLFQGLTDYIFYNNNLMAVLMISLGALVAGKEEKTDE